jgi:hypothetical protein
MAAGRHVTTITRTASVQRIVSLLGADIQLSTPETHTGLITVSFQCQEK